MLALAAAAVVTQPVLAEGLRKGEGSAEKAGFNAIGLARVDSTIEAAIRGGSTPGAALAIGRRGQLVRMRGYGRLSWNGDDAAVTDSTLYDIASLTKVVGTTSAVMILVERGLLDLDKPIYNYLTAWPWDGEQGRITLRHLLTHTSGLPAGADLWTTPGRVEKLERIARMRLANEPGLVTTYSDLGMIVVAAVIEAVTQEPLDDFLYREVFEPLGMRDTRFNPRAFVAEAAMMTRVTPILALPSGSAFFAPFQILARWTPPAQTARTTRIPSARIAPTERGVPRGYVHDRNAASLGGVAGHAGLFSSVRDLAMFAESMLEAMHGEDLPIISARTVNQFFQKPDHRRMRVLGWDVAQGERSSAGDYFTQNSVGHTGFTGTSIWIDPERDLFVVLLTNRLHPSAANRKHIAMRRAVHDAVQLAIEDEVVVARAD
ncbi:MAG TPA: serine hydrolase domain-containing protein [Longimicrobiales bacterium]